MVDHSPVHPVGAAAVRPAGVPSLEGRIRDRDLPPPTPPTPANKSTCTVFFFVFEF